MIYMCRFTCRIRPQLPLHLLFCVSSNRTQVARILWPVPLPTSRLSSADAVFSLEACSSTSYFNHCREGWDRPFFCYRRISRFLQCWRALSGKIYFKNLSNGKEDIAQLVRVPEVHDGLGIGSLPTNRWRGRQEDLQVQGHPSQHSEFKVSLGCMRSCTIPLKKRNEKIHQIGFQLNYA